MVGMGGQKTINVIGGGGHSKVVVDALLLSGFAIGRIFDENIQSCSHDKNPIKNIEILPEPKWWMENSARGIVAIGSNATRKKISQKLMGALWQNAIHPTAVVHPSVKLGIGVYIGARAVIQPGVIVGNHAIINTGSIVEHDVVIADFCHIAPGTIVTGHVHIGEGTFLGAGTVVIPEISIGSWTVIGAGSVVVRDFGSNVKAFGAPCQLK